MTTQTLAARIATLTAHVGNLETLHARSVPISVWTQELANALAFEIAGLHALIDQLNLDYEDTRDRELDNRFEASCR